MTMQHNHGASTPMTLDGGYIGSIDHAIANLHVGRSQGRRQGRQEGLKDGLVEGFDQGRAAGYTEGWNAASARGNENMAQQMAYTRQHIEEKERLKAEVERQSMLILQLEEKVRELTEENKALHEASARPGRTPGADLTQLVSALKEANGRLQQQVADSEQQFQERSKQYSELMWQYNRSLVFMNAVRGVLEDITSDKSPQADQIRAMFVDKYKQQVTTNLKEGFIKVEPEKDEAFAKALPRTRKFIMSMLDSVGKHQDHQNDGNDLTP